MMLMYKVVFAPETYVPYYHYYLITSNSKRPKTLGYLPAGIDIMYRKTNVSTIAMMQHITQLASSSRYDIIKSALLKIIPRESLNKTDFYIIQKYLTHSLVSFQA
jgi:hypothetical protein